MNRIFSGVQPTGNLHVGNYLGAIRNWVNMQHDYECIFCIVDLHAITVPQEPEALKQATREVAAAFIACGVDPEKNTIFHQSAVSVHAELAWILSCHTPLGWLNRMTQFKEKAKVNDQTGAWIRNVEAAFKLCNEYFDAIEEMETQNDHLRIAQALLGNYESIEKREKLKRVRGLANEAIQLLKASEKNTKKAFDAANLGLLSYPVLMAADIIGYKATHVPVGEDQKQHLELARDIAGAFNRQYDTEFFPLPEPVITGNATRVMSLQDGTKKMSKSDPSEKSRINLTDDADTIAKKIKKAKSDMEPGITWDPEKRPEAANLITLYESFSGLSRQQVLDEFGSKGFADFKKSLADVAVEHLSPITARMRELMADPSEIDAILKRGAEQANEKGQQVLDEAKELIGFLRV